MKNLATYPYVRSREVSFMWAHVRIEENERADFEARQATLGHIVYNAQ
jgi:ribonuclease HI